MNVTGPGNTQQDEWREKHMGEIMNACCFTGHRENKLHRTEKEILKDLDREISRALEDGYTTFICGMAYGVDIWAGEIVAKKRFWNHRIKLIAAVPFEGFEARWNEQWKNRYQKLLKKADEVHYICEGYASFVYQRRNEWMVDRSTRVIAVYNGEQGGTRNTINYVNKKGVPVILIEG